MAEQNCNRYLDYFVKLVSHTRSFSICFCVLNFVFSLVATLGNLLVIRALMNNSMIPATVKKLFLSLAFSDLAVGLCSQLMTASISAVMLKMASSEDDLAFFCPAVLIVLLYFMHLLVVASFLNVIVIAFDRLFAVSLHLRYQELVTPTRVTIVLVTLWLTSCVSAFLRHCSGYGYFCYSIYSDNPCVCSYLQSCKISSESDIPSKSASKCPNKGGTQTKKIRL